MSEIDKTLKQLHHEFTVAPTSRRRMLYERLRTRVATDILNVMEEEGVTLEWLAKKLRIKKSEMKEWIWTRDLKMSELCRMLDYIGAELYPIITPREIKTRSQK